MARIGFVGLGNMGSGMAANLARAGHEVAAFDLSVAALEKAVAAGCRAAGSAGEAAHGAGAVVTMLPAGRHVREVMAGEVFPRAAAGPLARGVRAMSELPRVTSSEVSGRVVGLAVTGSAVLLALAAFAAYRLWRAVSISSAISRGAPHVRANDRRASSSPG